MRFMPSGYRGDSGYGGGSGYRSKRKPIPDLSPGHVITYDGTGQVLTVAGNTPEAQAARAKQAEQQKGKDMTTKSKKASSKKSNTKRVPKLLEIVSPSVEPDVVRLKDLVPGELFRYPAGNPSAVYMVLDISQVKTDRYESGTRVEIPFTHTIFTALGTGKVFLDNKEKVIIPVVGKLEFTDA